MTEKKAKLVRCATCDTPLFPVRNKYGVCPVAAGVEKGFCDDGKLISWGPTDYKDARLHWWFQQFPSAVHVDAVHFHIDGLDGEWKKAGDKPIRNMSDPQDGVQYGWIGVDNRVWSFVKAGSRERGAGS